MNTIFAETIADIIILLYWLSRLQLSKIVSMNLDCYTGNEDSSCSLLQHEQDFLFLFQSRFEVASFWTYKSVILHGVCYKKSS